MGTSTQSFGPNFVAQIIPQMIKEIDEAKAHAFRTWWNMAWAYVFVDWHWFMIIGIIVGLFLIALLTYLLTGRWFMLGRVLYTYIHGGLLILCGVAFGPELYANNIFEVVNVLVYTVSFLLVGSILDNLKIRHHRW